MKEGAQSADDPSSHGGGGVGGGWRTGCHGNPRLLICPDQLELAREERRERRDGQTDRRRGRTSAKSSDAGTAESRRDVLAHVLAHPSRRRSVFLR